MTAEELLTDKNIHAQAFHSIINQYEERYLRCLNLLRLQEESNRSQAAALEAKDALINSLSDKLSLLQNTPVYLESLRPGDPRRDLRMRLDPAGCRHTLTYLSGTARQCGLCFQINPLWPGTSLGKPLVAAPRLTTYDPTPEARAASDQALRRIADEPAPGRIVD